jgi:hypothetical protein
MDRARVLATALLLGMLPASLPGAGQDTSGGSQAAPQAPSAPAPTGQAASPQTPSSAPAGEAQTAPANQQPSAGPEKSTKDQAAQKAPASPGSAKKRRKHVSPPAETRRVVVRRGGTDEPTAQIAPGLTEEQATRQRQRTEDLLNSTENNLRQLALRTLNQNQQDTIAQIRNYMAGARSALKDGDPQRARTLAFKARLLSDDLVKR